MPELLDLNLLAVSRSAGYDYPELLGLYAAEAPRRPARGRSEDRLIFYLAVAGNAPLPPAKRDQVLVDLAKVYYATPGSVTAALRAVADSLNGLLLERNLRGASTSKQGVGLFAQVVLRGDQIYLAQSGPVHTYLIAADQTHHFYSLDDDPLSLGQGRAAPVDYYQFQIHANDTLLVAGLPSLDWSPETLVGLHGQGPESLRRRLFNQPMVDMHAVLIQAKSGTGKIYPSRFVTTIQAAQAEPRPEIPGLRDDAPEPAALEPLAAAPLETAAAPLDAAAALPLAAPAAAQDARPQDARPQMSGLPERQLAADSEVPQDFEPIPEPGAGVHEIPLGDDQAGTGRQEPARRRPSRLGPVGAALRRATLGLLVGLRRLAGRILPSEPFISVPSPVMAGIALAVPAVMVSIAWAVYSQLGVTARYQSLYIQAEQLAAQASSEADIVRRGDAWRGVLQTLEQAENYGGGAPELLALRAQAQGSLDALDIIRRVDYQPAIVGGLPVESRITRITLAENDLYLLDSSSGSVLRAQPTSRGYVQDAAFQCGPNVPGVSGIGPLMDIDAWPAGYSPEADIVGMDASGNLIFCASDEAPTVEKLTQPANHTLQSLVGFTINVGDLYILDPQSNAVWIYSKSNFSEEPRLFYDGDVPVMQDIIDLTVNSDELYLLHAGGGLTLCYFSGLGVAPTRCSDPDYVDLRPGRENQPFSPPPPFIQTLFSPPPDPSLFLLEAQEQAIYQFSLRNLAYQRMYLSRGTRIPGTATAFAINTARRNIFLAVGYQVYYGVLP